MAKFWGNGKFPYTQLNNLNLDWLLKCVQELAAQIVEAVRGDIAQNKSEAWKEQARQNIDAQSTGAVVDVPHGGTGATTVVDALTALGSAPLLYFSMTTDNLVLQFSAAVRFLIVITSNSTSQHGAALVFCGRNSRPVISPLGTLGSAITLTGNASSLTVTLSNANSTTSVSILCLTTSSYSRIAAGQANSLSTLSEGQTTSQAAVADGEIISPAVLSDGEITSPAALADGEITNPRR